MGDAATGAKVKGRRVAFDDGRKSQRTRKVRELPVAGAAREGQEG